MSIATIEAPIEGLQPPIAKAREGYAVYKGQVIASSTAQGIIADLERSPKKVGVLLIDDGYDSMYIPPFCGVDGMGFDGGVAVVNVTNPLTIGCTDLPLGVSMMHELGHAKQYLEASVAFETKYKEAMGQVRSNYPSELRRTKSGEKISQLILENENVSLHEAPICDDLGLPFRRKYS